MSKPKSVTPSVDSLEDRKLLSNTSSFTPLSHWLHPHHPTPPPIVVPPPIVSPPPPPASNVGPVGPQGPMGPQGPQGAPGTPADMTVVSALQAQVNALQTQLGSLTSRVANLEAQLAVQQQLTASLKAIEQAIISDMQNVVNVYNQAGHFVFYPSPYNSLTAWNNAGFSV